MTCSRNFPRVQNWMQVIRVNTSSTFSSPDTPVVVIDFDLEGMYDDYCLTMATEKWYIMWSVSQWPVLYVHKQAITNQRRTYLLAFAAVGMQDNISLGDATTVLGNISQLLRRSVEEGNLTLTVNGTVLRPDKQSFNTTEAKVVCLPGQSLRNGEYCCKWNQFDTDYTSLFLLPPPTLFDGLSIGSSLNIFGGLRCLYGLMNIYTLSEASHSKQHRGNGSE